MDRMTCCVTKFVLRCTRYGS